MNWRLSFDVPMTNLFMHFSGCYVFAFAGTGSRESNSEKSDHLVKL